MSHGSTLLAQRKNSCAARLPLNGGKPPRNFLREAPGAVTQFALPRSVPACADRSLVQDCRPVRVSLQRR